MWYLDNRKMHMLHDICNQYGKRVLLPPDEVKNFSLLINSLLPVKVYLHGTSSPLPILLYPVTTHCSHCVPSELLNGVRLFSSWYGHDGKRLRNKKI